MDNVRTFPGSAKLSISDLRHRRPPTPLVQVPMGSYAKSSLGVKSLSKLMQSINALRRLISISLSETSLN